MYHDASTAVLLDLRRRFTAVVDVLRAVIRDGVTLARSLELDFGMARSGGLGVWLQVVEGLHRGLSDCIRGAVVHRREEAILRWRNLLRRDTIVHPYKWLRPDLVFLVPFL